MHTSDVGVRCPFGERPCRELEQTVVDGADQEEAVFMMPQCSVTPQEAIS